MEECEALCTRMAIMVNGQFKCLGSAQRLKNKFGEGYTIIAKVASGDSDELIERRVSNVRRFIEQTFPGATLKDLHHGYVHYQVSSDGVGWSRLFGTMERSRNELELEDYSVSQTTLEQIFLNFARAQRPPAEEQDLGCAVKLGNCCKFLCCCGCCRDNSVKSSTNL